MFVAVFLGIIVVFIAVIFVQRSKYKNKVNGAAFFFEGDQLVLNSLLPYPARICDIDFVELQYSPERLEAIASAYIKIAVVQKDGKKRTVGYKVNKFDSQTHPTELEKNLKAHGIRCISPQ